MNSNDVCSTLDSVWRTSTRWKGVLRPYCGEDVERLRGSVNLEYTLARLGANRLWDLLRNEPYVLALGALTGNQAVQQVNAGLSAIYVSGWQVAADCNEASQMYPDLNLYPADSVPNVVRRINHALLRANQIHHAEGDDRTYWLAPLIGDGDAGFGGALNTYELMRAMIEAGASCVHFEDQCSSGKRCGHLGGKVLVPTREAIQRLIAARLAADVMGVPTLIMARTDAESAQLLTSDVDYCDKEFLTGQRTPEGFYTIRNGLDSAIARAIAYAPYADLIWWETSTPDVHEAARFAQAVLARYPEKLLAYNCSPSFNWKKHLDDTAIARFQADLAAMGYRFQFVTLAGFHTLNLSMFELSRGYKREGIKAYCRLQEKELRSEREHGYAAVKHQRFAGTAYFDAIQRTIVGGPSSTAALEGSTELEQFLPAKTSNAFGLHSRAVGAELDSPTA